jgi:RNA polymerase sigma-70 factor (ECF subfamily)
MNKPSWQALRQDLLRFVRRRVPHEADAEDIVQEVFLRAGQHGDALRDHERLSAWLYRIARNAIIDHHRRRPSPSPEAPSPPPPENPSPEELSWCLTAFVHTLDEPYRAALTLTELQGHTQAEAAALEGVPLSTMKSRVQRGRRKLRQQIEACCEVALDRRNTIQSYQVRDPCACAPRP